MSLNIYNIMVVPGLFTGVAVGCITLLLVVVVTVYVMFRLAITVIQFQPVLIVVHITHLCQP